MFGWHAILPVLHLLNSKIPETQRIRSGVWTEPEYVGKEFAWKCPRGSREVEVAAVTAEVEVVAEIADQLAEVVVVNVEVAQEAEAENGVVPDVPHRIGQCRGVEVGLLLLQEDEDLDRPPARIKTDAASEVNLNYLGDAQCFFKLLPLIWHASNKCIISSCFFFELSQLPTPKLLP